jgi:hypothetical protein
MKWETLKCALEYTLVVLMIVLVYAALFLIGLELVRVVYKHLKGCL